MKYFITWLLHNDLHNGHRMKYFGKLIGLRKNWQQPTAFGQIRGLIDIQANLNVFFKRKLNWLRIIENIFTMTSVLAKILDSNHNCGMQPLRFPSSFKKCSVLWQEVRRYYFSLNPNFTCSVWFLILGFYRSIMLL